MNPLSSISNTHLHSGHFEAAAKREELYNYLKKHNLLDNNNYLVEVKGERTFDTAILDQMMSLPVPVKTVEGGEILNASLKKILEKLYEVMIEKKITGFKIILAGSALACVLYNKLVAFYKGLGIHLKNPLLEELRASYNDIDIRIDLSNSSASANLGLDLVIETMERLGATVKSYDLRQTGFTKVKYERDPNMYILGFGDRDAVKIDMVFHNGLKRKHLFLRDDWEACLNPWIEGSRELTFETEFWNPFQTFIDRTFNFIHIDKPEEIDRRGYPLLQVAKANGMIVIEEEAEPILFQTYQNGRENFNTLTKSIIENHLKKNPSAEAQFLTLMQGGALPLTATLWKDALYRPDAVFKRLKNEWDALSIRQREDLIFKLMEKHIEVKPLLELVKLHLKSGAPSKTKPYHDWIKDLLKRNCRKDALQLFLLLPKEKSDNLSLIMREALTHDGLLVFSAFWSLLKTKKIATKALYEDIKDQLTEKLAETFSPEVFAQFFDFFLLDRPLHFEKLALKHIQTLFQEKEYAKIAKLIDKHYACHLNEKEIHGIKIKLAHAYLKDGKDEELVPYLNFIEDDFLISCWLYRIPLSLAVKSLSHPRIAHLSIEVLERASSLPLSSLSTQILTETADHIRTEHQAQYFIDILEQYLKNPKYLNEELKRSVSRNYSRLAQLGRCRFLKAALGLRLKASTPIASLSISGHLEEELKFLKLSQEANLIHLEVWNLSLTLLIEVALSKGEFKKIVPYTKSLHNFSPEQTEGLLKILKASSHPFAVTLFLELPISKGPYLKVFLKRAINEAMLEEAAELLLKSTEELVEESLLLYCELSQKPVMSQTILQLLLRYPCPFDILWTQAIAYSIKNPHLFDTRNLSLIFFKSVHEFNLFENNFDNLKIIYRVFLDLLTKAPHPQALYLAENLELQEKILCPEESLIFKEKILKACLPFLPNIDPISRFGQNYLDLLKQNHTYDPFLIDLMLDSHHFHFVVKAVIELEKIVDLFSKLPSALQLSVEKLISTSHKWDGDAPGFSKIQIFILKVIEKDLIAPHILLKLLKKNDMPEMVRQAYLAVKKCLTNLKLYPLDGEDVNQFLETLCFYPYAGIIRELLSKPDLIKLINPSSLPGLYGKSIKCSLAAAFCSNDIGLKISALEYFLTICHKISLNDFTQLDFLSEQYITILSQILIEFHSEDLFNRYLIAYKIHTIRMYDLSNKSALMLITKQNLISQTLSKKAREEILNCQYTLMELLLAASGRNEKLTCFISTFVQTNLMYLITNPVNIRPVFSTILNNYIYLSFPRENIDYNNHIRECRILLSNINKARVAQITPLHEFEYHIYLSRVFLPHLFDVNLIEDFKIKGRLFINVLEKLGSIKTEMSLVKAISLLPLLEQESLQFGYYNIYLEAIKIIAKHLKDIPIDNKSNPLMDQLVNFCKKLPACDSSAAIQALSPFFLSCLDILKANPERAIALGYHTAALYVIEECYNENVFCKHYHHALTFIRLFMPYYSGQLEKYDNRLDPYTRMITMIHPSSDPKEEKAQGKLLRDWIEHLLAHPSRNIKQYAVKLETDFPVIRRILMKSN